MEKLSRILHDLDQGNINVELAKQQVLYLFAVSGSDTVHGCKQCGKKIEKGFNFCSGICKEYFR